MSNELDLIDPSDIIEEIAALCGILGWDITVPNTEGVNGLVIGTPEFIQEVIENSDLFDVYEKASITGENEIH